MEQKTIGTVVSVKKQWWLKVKYKAGENARFGRCDLSAHYYREIFRERSGIHKEKVDQSLRYASGCWYGNNRALR